MVCPEPPYTSVSELLSFGGCGVISGKEKTRQKGGFFVLSYVLGGRLAPASPVASDSNIRLPGGYVKQP